MPTPRASAEAASWCRCVRKKTAYERVLEILDREGAVDLDKRQASWREEGWTGYPGEGAAAASTAAGMASERNLGAVSSGTASSPREATAAAGTEEVVPFTKSSSGSASAM
jgi:hypothetical protein